MTLTVPLQYIPHDFLGNIFIIIWFQYFLISIMIYNCNLSLAGHVYHWIQVVFQGFPTLRGLFLFSSIELFFNSIALWSESMVYTLMTLWHFLAYIFSLVSDPFFYMFHLCFPRVGIVAVGPSILHMSILSSF